MTAFIAPARRQKIRSLGSGMYGEVWLERDLALDVERAVKYVDSTEFDDVKQAFAEPRTLLELKSDYIVEVFEAGVEGGMAYTVMEYMPRGSLGQLLEQGPLQLSLAKKWIIDLCRAVEFTHRRGWIHRDIKPSNVLLDGAGAAKLSDFGLAAKIDEVGSANAAGYGPHLAPEIFTLRRTSRLTDVYALGMTMYRLINGDAFLPGYSSFEELQGLILKKRYPERKNHQPYVPAQLRRVMAKALHLDPAQRYQSARDLRLAVEAVPVKCDWSPRLSKDGTTTWRTNVKGMRYEVLITSGSSCDVTVLKGGGEALRRVVLDCRYGLPRGKAEKHCCEILQRICTKGK